MKEFVRWLLDDGHEVRILIGDHDEPEAREILADAGSIGKVRPAAHRLRPVASTDALMSRITSVETVVATRASTTCSWLWRAAGQPWPSPTARSIVP